MPANTSKTAREAMEIRFIRGCDASANAPPDCSSGVIRVPQAIPGSETGGCLPLRVAAKGHGVRFETRRYRLLRTV